MRYSLLIFMLFISGCSEAEDGQTGLPIEQFFLKNGEQVLELTVEVASTPEQRRTGLMFRNELPQNNGMLFVMQKKAAHKFWMKNTLIPLDMIFFDEDKIVGIVENAKPHDLTPVGPDIPSNFVLEVNGGFVQAHGIDNSWVKK